MKLFIESTEIEQKVFSVYVYNAEKHTEKYLIGGFLDEVNHRILLDENFGVDDIVAITDQKGNQYVIKAIKSHNVKGYLEVEERRGWFVEMHEIIYSDILQTQGD